MIKHLKNTMEKTVNTQYNGRLKDNLEFVNTVDDSQKNK
jgi:hypothetical protein